MLWSARQHRDCGAATWIIGRSDRAVEVFPLGKHSSHTIRNTATAGTEISFRALPFIGGSTVELILNARKPQEHSSELKSGSPILDQN